MAATLWFGSTGGGSLTAASTDYYPVGLPGNSFSTTESNTQVILESPGTLKNLYTNVEQNATATSSTIVSRKGGVNGNLTVSIGSAATGDFSDSTHTDTVTAGDLWCWQVAVGTTGILVLIVLGCEFDATTNSVTKFTLGRISLTTNATIGYTGITGDAQNNNTSAAEATVRTKIRTSGTLKNMVLSVSANARAVTDTFLTRINGVDGNCTISVTSTATGKFEDITHTDTVTSGAFINFKSSPGASASTAAVNYIAIDYNTTNSTFPCNIGGISTAALVDFNGAYVITISGDILSAQSSTPDSGSWVVSPFAFTASLFGANVVTNTMTGISTFRVRKNTTNGNQVFTVAATTTGYFEDATNTDSIAISDKLNYNFSTANTAFKALGLGCTTLTGTVSGGGGPALSSSFQFLQLMGLGT